MLRESGRGGFTIAEMVVAIAILAILATIVIPNANQYLYHRKLEADAALLDSVMRGKMEFSYDVGAYPGRISQMSTVITPRDTTICNLQGASNAVVTFSAAMVNFWNGTTTAPGGGHMGPFFNRAVSTNGLPLEIGIAQDRLKRTTNNTTAGLMFITVPNVTYADAVAFNQIVDGTGTAGANRTDTSGTVRWSTTPSGPRDTLTLLWMHGVRNAC